MEVERQQETKNDQREQQRDSPTSARCSAPIHSPAHSLRQLHHTIGNRAVGRLLQAELSAKQATNHNGRSKTPEIVREVLHSPGQPLDSSTRAFMEARFGYDFKRVRVHTDEQADASASALGALAFTIGERIVFSRGAYAPETRAGRHLLAHELGHVLQQSGNINALQTYSPSAVSYPGDSAEQEAERVADDVMNDQGRRPVRVSSVAPRIARKARGTKTGTEPAAQSAETPHPVRTWAIAFQVINAIIDIINEYHRRRTDVSDTKSLPEHHSEVPATYLPLLRRWYQITHGRTPLPNGVVIETTGAMLQTHIAMAMEETRPLLSVLTRDVDAKIAQWLVEEFYAKVDEFKRRALSKEVSETIEATAKAAPTMFADLTAQTEEEKLKVGVAVTLNNIRLLNTTINRYLSPTVQATAAGWRNLTVLTYTYQGVIRQIIRDGKTTLSAMPVVNMTLPEALWFIKGGLDGIDAILKVSDPEKRAKVFADYHTFFGFAGRLTSIMGVMMQFLFGATALIGAVTYSLASVMGKAALAARVLSEIPLLMQIQYYLNWIGVLHGTAVLLNTAATGEERAKALFEIGISAAGIIGRFVAGSAFPATTAVLVAGVTTEAIVKKGVGASVNIIQAGLNICFDHMRTTALSVSHTALKLAIAAEMEMYETNPERKQELDRQAETLRGEIEMLLIYTIKEATTPYGADNRSPAAYGPSLINRFKPLAGRKMETVAQALEVAAEFIQIVAKCFAEPERILNDVATWTWKEYG